MYVLAAHLRSLYHCVCLAGFICSSTKTMERLASTRVKARLLLYTATTVFLLCVYPSFSSALNGQPAVANFTTVLDALVTGEAVTYDIDTRLCDGEFPSGSDIVYGSVDVFEYFYGERFGPVPYISFSTTVFTLNDQEGKQYLEMSILAHNSRS